MENLILEHKEGIPTFLTVDGKKFALIPIESKVEFTSIKSKAERWDALDTEIGKYYPTYDDEDEEIEPQEEGDLSDIGEAAARAFGYM